MQSKVDLNGNALSVSLNGKVTFSDHEEFRKICYPEHYNDLSSININLGGVEFVDSAVMGLFLLLKDEAEKGRVSLALVAPQGQVKKMFEISRFYDLFDIREA